MTDFHTPNLRATIPKHKWKDWEEMLSEWRRDVQRIIGTPLPPLTNSTAKSRPPKVRRKLFLTTADIEFLKENYRCKGAQFCADHFGLKKNRMTAVVFYLRSKRGIQI